MCTGQSSKHKEVLQLSWILLIPHCHLMARVGIEKLNRNAWSQAICQPQNKVSISQPTNFFNHHQLKNTILPKHATSAHNNKFQSVIQPLCSFSRLLSVPQIIFVHTTSTTISRCTSLLFQSTKYSC